MVIKIGDYYKDNRDGEIVQVTDRDKYDNVITRTIRQGTSPMSYVIPKGYIDVVKFDCFMAHFEKISELKGKLLDD